MHARLQKCHDQPGPQCMHRRAALRELRIGASYCCAYRPVERNHADDSAPSIRGPTETNQAFDRGPPDDFNVFSVDVLGRLAGLTFVL